MAPRLAGVGNSRHRRPPTATMKTATMTNLGGLRQNTGGIARNHCIGPKTATPQSVGGVLAKFGGLRSVGLILSMRLGGTVRAIDHPLAGPDPGRRVPLSGAVAPWDL